MLALIPVVLRAATLLQLTAAHPCDGATRARLLAPATPGDDAITLGCSVTLGPRDVVGRRVILEGRGASGVELACNGATIRPAVPPRDFTVLTLEIRSMPVPPGSDGAPRWDRPEGATIRGCRIEGSVRVWGMGLNGQGAAVRASSHALGHTERAQAAAPSRISLLDSTITGSVGIPLYLAPGVTGFTLRGSTIRGTSPSVALYLDAESGGNTIEGNTFDVDTRREVIAVDGSADNRIAGNIIALRGERGIDLYRNCGEGGTVRHQTPSRNTITGNRFRYLAQARPTPLKVGSRGGWGLNCYQDRGYPFGSSLDNDDLATDNVVAPNSVE